MRAHHWLAFGLIVACPGISGAVENTPVAAAPSATTAAAPPAPALTYDQMRRQGKAVPVASMSELNANLAALAGRLVELTGTATGFASIKGGAAHRHDALCDVPDR